MSFLFLCSFFFFFFFLTWDSSIFRFCIVLIVMRRSSCHHGDLLFRCGQCGTYCPTISDVVFLPIWFLKLIRLFIASFHCSEKFTLWELLCGWVLIFSIFVHLLPLFHLLFLLLFYFHILVLLWRAWFGMIGGFYWVFDLIALSLLKWFCGGIPFQHTCRPFGMFLLSRTLLTCNE